MRRISGPYLYYYFMGPGTAVHRQERCTGSGTRSVWIAGSLLGEPLQVGETDFEILSDHVVDVHQPLHQPGREGRGAVHEPSHVGCHVGCRSGCPMGGTALRQHCELGGVVALERPEEIELDDDFGR